MIKFTSKDMNKVLLINKQHIIYVAHNQGLETVVYLTDNNCFVIKETLIEVKAAFNS